MKIYDILISGVIEVKNIGRKNTQLILSGNIPKALLSLAIPIVINNFIQTMYNLTDTFWLGKLGTSEMAAISLVSPLQNIIVNFGQGITIAGSILISQHIGADDKKNAKSMANQIFVCAMLFSIVASISRGYRQSYEIEYVGNYNKYVFGPTLDYGISLGNRGSGFGNDVCKSSLWNNCCAFSF